MNDYYVTFRSLTSAQRASFEASRHGVRATLIRTPKSLSSTGCGYALRVDQIYIEKTIKILRDANIRFERILLSDQTGYGQEVRF